MLEKNFVSLNFLKKEHYTGSMQGMRYQVGKEGESPAFKLKVILWPEPYAFEVTKKELKQSMDFEFSEEGKEKAVEWINEQYNLQKELWDSVNPYK